MDKKIYRITYTYCTKEEKIASVKIHSCDPDKLQVLANLANLHIPAMTAFRKENPGLFNKVTLPLSPEFDVELRVIDKIRD